jgi:hypothetical protein
MRNAKLQKEIQDWTATIADSRGIGWNIVAKFKRLDAAAGQSPKNHIDGYHKIRAN